VNLNLGCGPHLAPAPWINVDRNSTGYPEDFSHGSLTPLTRKPDVIAPSWALPYPDASVDRLYAGHLMEHLSFEEVLATLREAMRVLKPGGEILMTGPDMTKIAELIYSGEETWDLFWVAHGTSGRGNPGGPGWKGEPGDAHLWNSTVEALWFAARCVFDNATVIPELQIPRCWPVVAFVGWQAAVLARKPL
jgi:hypothetical protein